MESNFSLSGFKKEKDCPPLTTGPWHAPYLRPLRMSYLMIQDAAKYPLGQKNLYYCEDYIGVVIQPEYPLVLSHTIQSRNCWPDSVLE